MARPEGLPAGGYPPLDNPPPDEIAYPAVDFPWQYDQPLPSPAPTPPAGTYPQEASQFYSTPLIPPESNPLYWAGVGMDKLSGYYPHPFDEWAQKGAGMLKSAGEWGPNLTTPTNIALGVATADLGPVARGFFETPFLAQAAYHVPQAMRDIAATKDPQERWRALMDFGLSYGALLTPAIQGSFRNRGLELNPPKDWAPVPPLPYKNENVPSFPSVKEYQDMYDKRLIQALNSGDPDVMQEAINIGRNAAANYRDIKVFPPHDPFDVRATRDIREAMWQDYQNTGNIPPWSPGEYTRGLFNAFRSFGSPQEPEQPFSEGGVVKEENPIDSMFPEIGFVKEMRQKAATALPPPPRESAMTFQEQMDALKRSRAAGDPWYVTASKAIIGEGDYNKIYGGDYMPVIKDLAPFLLMGKGGGERLPVSEEAMLPPETKHLLDVVRAAETGGEPPPVPPSAQENYDAARAARAAGGRIPVSRLIYQHQDWMRYMPDFADIKAIPTVEDLPVAPRPQLYKPGESGLPEDRPKPEEIIKEQIQGIKDDISKILGKSQWVPPPLEPLPGEGYADPNDIKNFWGYPPMYPKPAYVPRDYIDFLRFRAAPAQDVQPSYPAGTPPPYFPKPPENLEHMQTGGVVGSSNSLFGGTSLDDPYDIQIYPHQVYVPQVNLGVQEIPPSPDYPPEEPQPEFIDSADYNGAANFIYVDPRASGVPGPTNNYFYNPNYEEMRDRDAHYAALSNAYALAGSIRGGARHPMDQYQAMLQQQAAIMQEHMRQDQYDARLRHLQQIQEQETRFGPPRSYHFYPDLPP